MQITYGGSRPNLDSPSPVILTGGNRNVDVMDGILKSTNIEYFGLCHTFIGEPDLINKWSEGY